MLDEMIADGFHISDQQLESIYGPAGLDIGSENAEEIALSIVAEIQAVLKNRKGTSLCYKTTVHNRTDEQIFEQMLAVKTNNI